MSHWAPEEQYDSVHYFEKLAINVIVTIQPLCDQNVGVILAQQVSNMYTGRPLNSRVPARIVGFAYRKAENWTIKF